MRGKKKRCVRLKVSECACIRSARRSLFLLSLVFFFVWIKKRQLATPRPRRQSGQTRRLLFEKNGTKRPQGEQKKKRKKKKGFLFPTRAALYVNYAPLSLSLSIDNKKKLRRRRRVKQSARGSFFFDVHLQFASVRLHQHLVSLRGHFQALQAVGGRRTQRDRRAGGFNATNARSSGGDSGVR